METANFVMDILEDGEISDSDYTPLPRPPSLLPSGSLAKPIANRLGNLPVSSDEQDSTDSDDSCDSDGPKRRKLARPQVLRPVEPAVPEKYNVWAKDLQEAALNEQLLNCDVGLTYDRSRDVESYDYNIAHRSNKFESERTSPTELCDLKSRSTKRRHEDRGTVRDRLGPRTSDVKDRHGPRSSDVKDRLGSREGSPTLRLLPQLKVSEESTPEDVAVDIANKLYETKEMLVHKVVAVLGIPRAIQLFNKTREIESDGGMMIFNGARRRTPGGVFFYMLRNEPDITREQHDSIFEDDQKELAQQKRVSKANKRRADLNRLRLDQELQLPALLTRADLVAQQAAAERQQEEGELEVSNPPPSPATDPRNVDCDDVAAEIVEGARKVTTYEDDDFLDLSVGDDMEVF